MATLKCPSADRFSWKRRSSEAGGLQTADGVLRLVGIAVHTPGSGDEDAPRNLLSKIIEAAANPHSLLQINARVRRGLVLEKLLSPPN